MGIWQSTRKWFGEGTDIIHMMRSAFSDDPNAWEWAIARFEADDRRHPPPHDPIVFTGSSSITFWDTLAQDMAPLPVINHGFGGSRIGDVVHYADRIVIPYHPRAVVLFAGTNDIAGRKPKTAQQVYEEYRAFVDTVQAALPATPVYFISITPAPSRWQYWPVVCEANELIRAYTATANHLHFIDMTAAVLGPDGKPRRDLYRSDKLHPNQKGYAAWTATIKPVLMDEL